MENSATARSGPSSHQSESGFDVELRISPLPVLIVLFLAGPILYTVSVPLGMSGQVQHGIILFSLTAFLSTGVALALLQWSDLAGRWMTMVALTVGIYGSALCLGAPVALNLVAVSVVISASLISLPAMGVTAVCQTALLIVLFRNPLLSLLTPALGS